MNQRDSWAGKKVRNVPEDIYDPGNCINITEQHSHFVLLKEEKNS